MTIAIIGYSIICLDRTRTLLKLRRLSAERQELRWLFFTDFGVLLWILPFSQSVPCPLLRSASVDVWTPQLWAQPISGGFECAGRRRPGVPRPSSAGATTPQSTASGTPAGLRSRGARGPPARRGEPRASRRRGPPDERQRYRTRCQRGAKRAPTARR